VSRIYVVDTSYLLELYDVPGASSDECVARIKSLFGKGVQDGCSFFVTIGCILEVGNHIADVRSGRQRRKLAIRLKDDVTGSVNEGRPWVVLPPQGLEELVSLLDVFPDRFAGPLRLGLVDAQVIEEARRLKGKHGSLGAVVHIWTKDSTLKGHEPDHEKDAYLG